MCYPVWELVYVAQPVMRMKNKDEAIPPARV